MRYSNIKPDNTVFVLLCFEGPDQYSLAGGLGVRINNISSTIAEMGFPTHLFFIGEPDMDGEESRLEGKLILHRWCQWISKYHRRGVYDGENEKLYDFNTSIPGFLKDNIVKPAAAQGKLVVILGEEWQTAEVMCRLSETLQYDGLRSKVVMFWNANNTFSFHRIDWPRLNYCTTITTVSRYMKHIMWRFGVNPLIIPNGIPKTLLRKVDDTMASEVRRVLGADLILCKVARWDPDKGWNVAIEAVAELKQRGLNPVLLARGGIEPYGQELMNGARSLDLKVKEAWMDYSPQDGFLKALQQAASADVIDVKFHMPPDFLRLLYRSADAVLANSGHEPFGLVGLEAMAAGGVVFCGSTGEDYAIPFINSFMLETAEPEEIIGHVMYLRNHPEESIRIREAARQTSRYFTWEAAVENLLSKIENQAWIQGSIRGKPHPVIPEFEISDTGSGRVEENYSLTQQKRKMVRGSTDSSAPSHTTLTSVT